MTKPVNRKEGPCSTRQGRPVGYIWVLEFSAASNTLTNSPSFAIHELRGYGEDTETS